MIEQSGKWFMIDGKETFVLTDYEGGWLVQVGHENRVIAVPVDYRPLTHDERYGFGYGLFDYNLDEMFAKHTITGHPAQIVFIEHSKLLDRQLAARREHRKAMQHLGKVIIDDLSVRDYTFLEDYETALRHSVKKLEELKQANDRMYPWKNLYAKLGSFSKIDLSKISQEWRSTNSSSSYEPNSTDETDSQLSS